MVEVISSIDRVAIKDYEDSAGVWIKESLSDIRSCGELTFSELKQIAILKAKNWKILKGEKYNYSVCKQDGELYVFRCNKAINAICNKLNMYQYC